MVDSTAMTKRSELEGRLAEKRRQMYVSILVLLLFGIGTLYNLKARMFALGVITLVLFGAEFMRFTLIKRSLIPLEYELKSLPKD